MAVKIIISREYVEQAGNLFYPPSAGVSDEQISSQWYEIKQQE